MIDKSIRQYYANGQLVKPGKGRAGYAGEELVLPFEGARTLVRKQDLNKYNTTDKLITPYEGARTVIKNPNYISPEEREYEYDLSQIGRGAGKVAYSPKEKAAIKAGTLKPELGHLTDFLFKGAEDPTYEQELTKKGGGGGGLGSFNPFKKGYETIAGTFGPIKDSLTNKFLPQDRATGALDLGSMAKGAFKNIAMNKARNFVLGKLGLGALAGPLGLASMFFPGMFGGKGIMQGLAGLAGRTREPGQTQAGYEQARELGQLGKRKDYMWNRMLEDKPYSEKNLIDVINKIAKKKGAVDADDMIGIGSMPQIPVSGAWGPQEYLQDKREATPASTLTTDYAFEDAKVAQQQKAAEEGAKQAAEAQAAASAAAAAQAVDRHRNQPSAPSYSPPSEQSGGSAQGGGGGGYGGPAGGHHWSKGGYVDKPLRGRNRYL